MKVLKSILQSLKESNYLTGKCLLNENTHYEFTLLKNGMVLREQLLKQWLNVSTAWSSQRGGITQNDQHIKYDIATSFLESNEFQNTYANIYQENLVSLSNAVALKSIYNNCHNVVREDDLFYGSKTKTLLVTDFFVAEENALSKYYNLQRERKIWWMRHSFNPSRYRVEPYDARSDTDSSDEILKMSKFVTITSSFPYGLVDMEYISLVPVHKLNSSYLSFNQCKISLMRSVINLELTTCALILDANVDRTENRNYTLMLNRKLAPYQILLANLHEGNETVDELTLHLQYILKNIGFRLYDNFLRTNCLTELEKKLMYFDSLGIPYILVVDCESIRNGLLKMRNRDTTLFETIHITDVASYLLKIFKQ